MAAEAAELYEEHQQRRNDLRAVAGRAQSTSVLASQRHRPVAGPFAELFPNGLRPGASVAVRAARPSLDATALRSAITLAAGLVPADGWVAAVGVPSLGVLAAAEAGLALDRLVFLAAPVSVWGTVAVAAVDAFDVIVLSVPKRPKAAEIRRLAGRARERATTVVACGPGAAEWGGEARVTTTRVDWEGLGQGNGVLQRCRVGVALDGRGGVRPRTASLLLQS